MHLMERDVVVTVKVAIEYLKISRPTFLKLSASEGSGPQRQGMDGGFIGPKCIGF